MTTFFLATSVQDGSTTRSYRESAWGPQTQPGCPSSVESLEMQHVWGQVPWEPLKHYLGTWAVTWRGEGVRTKGAEFALAAGHSSGTSMQVDQNHRGDVSWETTVACAVPAGKE